MKLEDYFEIEGRYEIKDGVYNVDGDAWLKKQVDKLPFKFGKVTCNFYCSDINLTTLEGCTSWVGGNFDCSNNFLTSLKGCTKSVGGSFECYNNHLTSLEGAPTHISGSFWCDDNFLTSLKGCPTSVGGYFSCDEILHNTKEYRQYEIIKELRK